MIEKPTEKGNKKKKKVSSNKELKDMGEPPNKNIKLSYKGEHSDNKDNDGLLRNHSELIQPVAQKDSFAKTHMVVDTAQASATAVTGGKSRNAHGPQMATEIPNQNSLELLSETIVIPPSQRPP